MFVRSHLITATLILTIGAGLSASEAAEPKYEGDVFDVTTIDRLEPNGPYSKIWEPYLAKWGSKHFVAAYGLQVTGKSDMGDIVCSISRDAGKTWGHRVMVFDHRQRNGTVQYAYNNAVLFRPPNQDVIWLFAMRAPMHYRDSENADLVAAYSADGGYSWHHVEIAMEYQGSLIIVAGIETVQREGVTHYLLPAHRNSLRRDPHGDRRQFVLESQSLLHWKLSGFVPYPDDDPVFLHEGGISATDKDGELKMVMRTATMDRERPFDPPLAYSSTSVDGGRTWTTAKPEPELPNFRSKSFFGKNSDGAQICVYGDDVDRRGLFYKTRDANGNWSKQHEFYVAKNRNSYPTLVEDKPGQWLAVWDSSDSVDVKRTAIRFGRIKSKPKALTKAGVVFTFDDRNFEDWIRAIPIFDQFGAKATFFISGKIDEAASDAIEKLVAHGHAIGSHSVNHVRAVEYCKQRSTQDYLDIEIRPQIEQFTAVDLSPTSFAYPMSDNSEVIDQALLGTFRHVRTGRNLDENEKLAETDLFFVPANQIQNHGCLYAKGIDHAPSRPDRTFEQIESALKRAAENDEIIVFYAHRIAESGKGNFITPQVLTRVLSKAKQLGLNFYTFDDLP